MFLACKAQVRVLSLHLSVFFQFLSSVLSILSSPIVLLFLGPIHFARVIVTFHGKFRLLTLSYLAKKDCPFDNRTFCGVTRPLSNIFFFHHLLLILAPTIFFNIGFAISPISSAATEPSNPAIGKRNPLLFPFSSSYFASQMPNTSHFLLILKSPGLFG